MKSIPLYSHLVCIVLGLQLVAAKPSLDGEETTSYWCDEKVLDFIVNKLNEISKKQTEMEQNKLNEINKKVETIDCVNKKLDMLDGKLMWLNNNNKILEHLIATSAMQVKLEALNQTMKDIHQGQLEQTSNVEKHFVDIKRTLHEEIKNQASVQRMQIEKLTSAMNEQQNMKKIEAQIEQGFNDIKEKYENITTATKRAEHLSLEKQFSAINQTLLTNQHNFGEKLWKQWENLTNALKIQQHEIFVIKEQTARILNNNQIENTAKCHLEYKTDNEKIISLLNTTNKEFKSIQQQIHQSLVDSKAQFGKLQNTIQTIIPKAEHLTIAAPNIAQNIQKSRRNLTKQDLYAEFENLRNTIGDFNQTLNSFLKGYDFSFDNCTTALQLTGSSGVYNLNMPAIGLAPFHAYCLKDAVEGAGWTIIQRRQDGSISFNRTWHDYKHGFGDPNGEYWLGLEKIYAMTSKEKYELWIELGDHKGERRHAKYGNFEIANEKEKYYMKTIGDYTGDAGDSLYNHAKFSTFDQKNDVNPYFPCTQEFQSAWWQFLCLSSSLNGEYNNNEKWKGINWRPWHGSEYSLKYAHMAIRPVK